MITSKILNYHLGKTGDAGKDGINGTDITNVGLSKLQNPLCELFTESKVANLLKGSLSITRSGDAFYLDRYGKGHWILDSTLWNYTTRSHNSNFWQDQNFSYSVRSGNILDPDGGNLGNRLQFGEDTTVLDDRIIGIPLATVPTGKSLTVQFWAATPNTVQSIDVSLGDGASTFVESRTVNTGDLGSNWTFFEATFSSLAVSPSVVYVNPRCITGTFFDLVFVGVADSNSSVPRIDTDGAIASINNPSNETRLNNGIMIEDAATNQCLDSQDLLGDSWSVVAGDISITKPTVDTPYGARQDNVMITSNGLDDITLRMTNALLTDATAYTVSFYAQQLSGNAQDITVNVGGGSDVSVNELPNPTGFNRVFAEVTSSSGGYLDINILSPANAFQLVIWGVQVETGKISSYMRTGDTETLRAGERLSLTYDSNLPDISEGLTVFWCQSDIPAFETGINRTVFTNVQAGADLFNAYYSDTNDDLIINHGTMNLTVANARQAEEITLTYDGTDLICYLDAVNSGATNTGTPSNFVATELVVCSDDTDGQINGKIAKFKVLDSALNQDEVIYNSGVINAS